MTKQQILAAKAEQNPSLVLADICLYGIRQTGAGWLAARHDGRMFGTGDPVQGRTFTEAVFQAVDAICTGNKLGLVCGHQVGLVRIFHPGGDTMTVIDLQELIPTYGDMARVPAPVFGPVKSDVALLALGRVMADAAEQRTADEHFNEITGHGRF